MFDSLVFTSVPGKVSDRRIQVLALSTCGFCRRGQEFLESRGIAYEYVHLDTVDPEVKARVKQEFKDAFQATLSYPALVIDGNKQTIGYVKRFWEELLDLPHEDDGAPRDAEPLD